MRTRATEEILTTADGDRWAALLQEIGEHDFCHLPQYSTLAETAGQGEARLYAYREPPYLVAFPVLVREIEAAAECGLDGIRRDVTSVYGYAGPIANRREVPEEVARRFTAFVSGDLAQLRAVSALSRMHPLLDKAPLLRGLGELCQVGWTLSADLTRPEEEQLAAYRRNHRQDIRKLEAMGVTCGTVGTEAVDAFADIYYENMDRVGASSEYYFSRNYFARLLTGMPGIAYLFACHHQGEMVAAGIFTICQGIAQWFLSGSRSDFAGPPPTKLMFDVARRWAMERGARVLHLGGGVGGSRDSLYHFKRGFTQREHDYCLWRHVADRAAYDRLVSALGEPLGGIPDDGFFPLYRHPALQAAAKERQCAQ